MARSFALASSQYLGIGSAVVSAPPLTMACWFNCTSLTADQSLIAINLVGGDDAHALVCRGTVGGDPVEAISWRTTSAIASTSTGYSSGVWHHGCAVIAADDDRSVYIDGGSKGTDGTLKNPSSVNETLIGALDFGGKLWFAQARIAEPAIWNVALTDAEVAVLATGIRPIFVRPDNIVSYWPLIRDDDLDLVGGSDMTPYNSPTIGAHPPGIYYGIPPFIVALPATAAAADVNSYFMHYQRLRRVV